MNKKKTVREYDILICNQDYQDDFRYVYIEPKNFQALTIFIREFISSSDRTDVLDFLRIGYKRSVGDTITFKNYVGVIQLNNGFQLEILPKIDLTEDEKRIKTKRIFLRMLRSMKNFPGKKFSEASLQVDKMNLYELFIQMYIQETDRLVKKGIKSFYVAQKDNLNYFKGKLDVSKQIRKNALHQERFYVSYEDFLPDIPENRLIKTTLLTLKSMSSSPRNIQEIYQLLTYFEMVNTSLNYEKDFNQITITRNNHEYQTLIAWSKVFLFNKSFSAFSGNSAARALLFPMESVYESYVACQMKKIFIPRGWSVSCQDASYYLFIEPKKSFGLRPDLVIIKNKKLIIMDTKWKKLDFSKKNYGIAREDMYQMYAYSKKYHSSIIYLLYPLTNEARKCHPISFNSGDGLEINIWFIDIENVKINLNNLMIKIEGE